jgi:2-oxoglutarate ferredoxin oxidoreductase subunit gamma
MTEKTFMAGFGGQGVVSLGQMWVYCAMKEGLQVTFYPFYGAEKRGGVARASVIVSDAQIASPIVTTAHSVVVMNQDSLPVCETAAGEGAIMIINSNLVKREPVKPGIRIIRIPCNEIAEGIGDLRIANMVMMGALSEVTGATRLDKLEEVLKTFFPRSKHDLIPMNVAAVEAGRKAARG